MTEPEPLEIDYPAGVRHKDRDELEGLLAELGKKIDEDTFEEVLGVVEFALVAGSRKVPGWAGR